jgi:hypothetical protein
MPPGSVPRPRPGRTVRGLVRRGHGGRRDRSTQDPAAVSSRELLCRTLRVDRPNRGHRPDAGLRQQHLRRVLAGYAAHYNRRRPHRSLTLRPPRPDAPVREPIRGRIRRRPILGGLINEYGTGSLKPLVRRDGRVLAPDTLTADGPVSRCAGAAPPRTGRWPGRRARPRTALSARTAGTPRSAR